MLSPPPPLHRQSRRSTGASFELYFCVNKTEGGSLCYSPGEHDSKVSLSFFIDREDSSKASSAVRLILSPPATFRHGRAPRAHRECEETGTEGESRGAALCATHSRPLTRTRSFVRTLSLSRRCLRRVERRDEHDGGTETAVRRRRLTENR